MKNIDFHHIKDLIEKDLNSQKISGRVLLDRLNVIDESSRKTAAYLDHNYSPFYYYLGKYFQAENVIEIGFDLGLLSCSFMKSFKGVENFLGFCRKDQNKISRIGISNIKKSFKGNYDFYVGEIYDSLFNDLVKKNQFKLAIINDETTYDKHLAYLDFLWEILCDGGIIVCEHINSSKNSKDAFLAFLESKKIEYKIFKTRYGTGVFQK